MEQKLGVNQDRMIPMVWLGLLEGGGGYMSTISVDIASDGPGAQSASAARGGGAGGILDTRTPVNTDRDRADTGPGHGLYVRGSDWTFPFIICRVFYLDK